MSINIFRYRGPTAGLETCFGRGCLSLKKPRTKEIYESLKKNQTGRPFTAPCGGPHRVLLPFLAEDLKLTLTPVARPWQLSNGRAIPPDPQIGDSLRIPEPHRRMQEKFRTTSGR